MSVLIKGMEMPSECEYCPMCRFYRENGNVWCNAKNMLLKFHWQNPDWTHLDVKRPDWCPLVDVPPHGVLKDTTAFDERIRNQYCKNCERRFGIKNGKRKEVYEIGGVPCRACDIGDMLDWLDDAPTIIEAEGREE